MIFVVQYKYLNCAADKTINAGHTAILTVTINNRILTLILLMMLFVTSWCKSLKINPFRDMHLCHLKAFFWQINTLINLYMPGTAQLKNV